MFSDNPFQSTQLVGHSGVKRSPNLQRVCVCVRVRACRKLTVNVSTFTRCQCLTRRVEPQRDAQVVSLPSFRLKATTLIGNNQKTSTHTSCHCRLLEDDQHIAQTLNEICFFGQIKFTLTIFIDYKNSSCTSVGLCLLCAVIVFDRKTLVSVSCPCQASVSAFPGTL